MEVIVGLALVILVALAWKRKWDIARAQKTLHELFESEELVSITFSSPKRADDREDPKLTFETRSGTYAASGSTWIAGAVSLPISTALTVLPFVHIVAASRRLANIEGYCYVAGEPAPAPDAPSWKLTYWPLSQERCEHKE
jgi:hypothetical protein